MDTPNCHNHPERPATGRQFSQWGRYFLAPLTDTRADQPGFQGACWPLCEECMRAAREEESPYVD